MIKYETGEGGLKIIKAIFCDRCGGEIRPSNTNGDFVNYQVTPPLNPWIEYQEVVSVYVSGGYGSVFGDGAALSCHFCESCAKDMFGKFLAETE